MSIKQIPIGNGNTAPVGNFPFNIIEQNKHLSIFNVVGEPELLYILKSNSIADQYYVINEDAYELEPWKSGMLVMSREQIKTKYGVDVQ